MAKPKTVLAWHFLSDTGKLRDGSDPPDDGVVLRYEGEVVPRESGLHASVRALDALGYVPGAVICRVRCGGVIVEHGDPVDKIACSERTILWRADATDTLRAFARWCALSVADKWDMPPAVRDYLTSGDESKRAAAWAAAMAAASDAAMAAAYAASSDAAWDAAWSAAWDAAWSAAWDAAWDAARDAARAAAWDAAWDAASGAQNKKLHKMLMALKPNNRKEASRG